MTNNKTRVAIVDDHNVVRQGLASIINADPDLVIHFEAEDHEDLMNKMKWKIKPELILMDFNLKEKYGDLVVADIRSLYGESIPILGLSFHKEELIIKSMMEAGANGFVFKDADYHELIDAIKSTVEVGFYVNQDVTKMLIKNFKRSGQESDSSDFSQVELSMLRLICQQKTNDEMADLLNLSKNTIHTYRNRLLAKTNSNNTAGMVIFAIRNGIYHLGVPLE